MVGVTAIAALLLVSGDFEATATVIAEARAGHAPIAPGSEDHEPAAAGLLTPGLELAYHDHRLDLTLDYALRGFVRYTENLPSAESAPVWLHTAALKLNVKATRRTTITADAT